MAHQQYLIFNGENIPKPMSYTLSLSDVEADSGGTTEAGTTQRDLVREGVAEIQVCFQVTRRWLQKLRAYKKLPKLTVTYLDTETDSARTAEMYLADFEVKLVSDTSYGSLWEVSFSLREF